MAKEVSLPKATMAKMIKEVLPENLRCSADARDLAISCCMEFIAMLTQECSDICDKSKKQTIRPEHVLQALKTLEFNSYVDEVSRVHMEHKSEKAEVNARNKKRKAVQLDMTPEEAAEQQRLLFDNAKTRFDQARDAI